MVVGETGLICVRLGEREDAAPKDQLEGGGGQEGDIILQERRETAQHEGCQQVSALRAD